MTDPNGKTTIANIGVVIFYSILIYFAYLGSKLVRFFKISLFTFILVLVIRSRLRLLKLPNYLFNTLNYIPVLIYNARLQCI